MGASEAGDDLDLQDLSIVAPPVTVEELDKAIFQLTYKQHGGSGTNLNLTEVEAMDWRRFVRWLGMLEEQRSAEQRALEKAARKK